MDDKPISSCDSWTQSQLDAITSRHVHTFICSSSFVFQPSPTPAHGAAETIANETKLSRLRMVPLKWQGCKMCMVRIVIILY